jgi:hypothetical protein
MNAFASFALAIYSPSFLCDASVYASTALYNAADVTPHIIPMIASHLSFVVMPFIDTATLPRNAATESQNFRLDSFLLISSFMLQPPFRFCVFCDFDHEEQEHGQNIKGRYHGQNTHDFSQCSHDHTLMQNP